MSTKKFYGEITVGVVAESELGLEQLKSKLDADGLRGKLVLRTSDGMTVPVEIQEFFYAEWEEL